MASLWSGFEHLVIILLVPIEDEDTAHVCTSAFVLPANYFIIRESLPSRLGVEATSG